MSEEELRHYVDEYFEKYWSVSFDKFLENQEEADEISEWALKEVKRLKNKNEELKDKLEFVKLSNPEQNLKYFKLVDSNRRKINCLRGENKKLKDQLDFSNNIINELEKEIINTIEETRNLQDYSKWYVEGYEEVISLTHSSHSGVMLETIKSTTIKRYEYLLNKLQELKNKSQQKEKHNKRNKRNDRTHNKLGGIDEEII